MKVSIIIPAYNARRWLPETLGSVRDQGFEDAEIIVVDDGSTDGTGDYVRTQWPTFHLVQTENKGVSHARNLGTAHASGELIQYLDADDLLLPGKLSRQVRMFEEHPGTDVVYANWQRFTTAADGSHLAGDEVKRRIQDVNVDAEIAFFTGMWCPTGAYLYRRAFLDKVLPWKDWLPVIQDARFALDCAMAGARWLHDAEVSVLYRQHAGGSVSTASRRRFAADCLANARDVCQHWLQAGQLTDQRRAAVADVLAGVAMESAARDHDLFAQAIGALASVSPGYRPNAPRLRAVLSRLIGYPAAERLLGLARRLLR